MLLHERLAAYIARDFMSLPAFLSDIGWMIKLELATLIPCKHDQGTSPATKHSVPVFAGNKHPAAQLALHLHKNWHSHSENNRGCFMRLDALRFIQRHSMRWSLA